MRRNLVPCLHFWRERHAYNRHWRKPEVEAVYDAHHCAVCCLSEDFREAGGSSRWSAWRSARRFNNLKHLVPVGSVRTRKEAARVASRREEDARIAREAWTPDGVTSTQDDDRPRSIP